ncbi:MAG: CHAT domain-containing protein, partial [Bacteroidota bacterium]
GLWLSEAIFDADLLTQDRWRCFTFITEGPTVTLPFAALPVRPIKQLVNMSRYPYLLAEKEIKYDFSLALWLRSRAAEHQQSVTKDDSVLALFPFALKGGNLSVYNGSAAAFTLSALESEQEMDRMGTLPAIDFFSYPLASKQTFLEQSTQYPILYLSSHAGVEASLSRYPFVAFTRADSIDQRDLLFASEILNHRFPSRLVFLNACQSAVGPELEGKGVYSLSRSFAYAGARSVVATLWPVDDHSAGQIGGEFMRLLRQAEQADAALAEAQQSLFDLQDPSRHHPYFWAAYRRYGN